VEELTTEKKHKYHHGDLYNALIDSGSQVIREKGLNSLSLREVAKRLNVSHTAPYRHFKDKNALMVAIAQKEYDRLGKEMQKVATHFDLPAVERIVECGCKYVEYTLRNPEFASLMFNGQYKSGKAHQFSHQDNSCFQIFVELFSEAQKAGDLRAEPSQLQALCLWTSMHGLMMLFVSGQIQSAAESNDQVKKLAQVMQSNILSGFRANP
tara:strand:+ start:1611 stop:2240 length:630 start_codon:yes stop_codon:yes gene_type:complete